VPPRMFQDLVVSGVARSGRGRARALPVSVIFHGLAVGAAVILPQLATDLPPVAAAPPPPIPTFHRVQVVEVTPPAPPRVTAAARRPLPDEPRTEPAAPVVGTGPAISDPSRLGEGTIEDDTPPMCLRNCTGGEATGAILPGTESIGDSDGEGPPVLRRAGRDVTPPAKLSGNPPVYPELAKRARIEGDVVIECTIDPSGRVVDATVIRSIPLLDDAALEAVRGWRYRPTLVDGVPVPILMTVTARFRIR
jgi:periplasmic protein TonB